MGANGRRDFPRYAAGLTVQLIVGSVEIKIRKPDYFPLVAYRLPIQLWVVYPWR